MMGGQLRQSATLLVLPFFVLNVQMKLLQVCGPLLMAIVQQLPLCLYELQGSVVLTFHLQDALLCHLGHLCVPPSERAKMIWEVHYSRVAGHFGVEKTVAVLQKYFYWPNLRQDVGKYIKSCTACAISKTTIKKQGLYTPLPLYNQVFFLL
jgi:hypothetical protein